MWDRVGRKEDPAGRRKSPGRIERRFASGIWEEIVFLGEKSDIHIINPCGESAWWKENEKQVMQILDTLQYDPETTADECQVEVQQQIEEGFLPEGSVTGITISTRPGETRYELSDVEKTKQSQTI